MLKDLLKSLSHSKMRLLITAFYLFFAPNQGFICQVYGSVYEVDEAYLADLIVYEELSEVTADIVVYEQQNRLYADKPGMWYFEDKEDFAHFKIYFTPKKSEADFVVFFTEFESFSGCQDEF